jgi:hypothetical protein
MEEEKADARGTEDDAANDRNLRPSGDNVNMGCCRHFCTAM